MIFDKSMIKPSFFDTNSKITSKQQHKPNQKLWLTEEDFYTKFQCQFRQLDKGQLLYSGSMCKQDSNTEINEYFFKLYDQYLVQYKVNSLSQIRSKIIGIMDLSFVKVDNQDNINESEDELPFFLFSRDQQYDILVPEVSKEFYEWERLFRSRCIMTNFGKYYENKHIIGKGSFAKVMLCQRNCDGKKFAVKTYDKAKIKKSSNPEAALLGLKNEVKLMQQLHHKNIIHLHEVYEGEFHIYLVLDLLTGGELFTKLHKIDNYSEKNACLFLKNLLESLDYLHSKGIMHRDIKPENLIFKDQNSETEIILADFGLSEKYAKKEETLIFKRCGTPGYVAPEILNNKPYDTQVDVFSAGIIFYIILTGYSPFFGDSYEEILNRNKKCQICFEFEKIDIKLSPEALDLLKLMLKENPKERLTAQQALLHPWFGKFLTDNNNKNTLKLPLLSHQMISNQSQILKQTQPNHEKFSNSNELITNSPVILGDINEIKSPFNVDSPQILDATPVKNASKSKFSDYCKEIVENNNLKVQISNSIHKQNILARKAQK